MSVVSEDVTELRAPVGARASLPKISVFGTEHFVNEIEGLCANAKNLSSLEPDDALALTSGAVIVESAHPDAGAYLQRLAAERPQTTTVVVGDDLPTVDVRALLRLPSSDILSSQSDAAAIIDIAARLYDEAADRSGPNAVCWAYVGAVGGAGVTTIAVESAFAVARRSDSPSVCLIDLNLTDGMTAAYLDGQRKLDMSTVCRAPERLDESLLKAFSWEHEDGVAVFATARDADGDAVATEDGVLGLLDVACAHYDHVIVDMPRHRGPWSKSILAAVDEVMVVSELTIPSLHAAADLAADIDRLRDGNSPARVVLNRMVGGRRNRHAIPIEKAERAIGRDVNATISSDWDAARSAVNLGSPIAEVAPKSTLVSDIEDLVNTFAPAPVRAEAPAARRWRW